MNESINDTSERMRLRDAIAATALVSALAVGISVTVAVLTSRCVIVDAIDHLKKKGGKHVP